MTNQPLINKGSILFVFFTLCISTVCFAQCQSSVKVIRAKKSTVNKGEVVVEIVSNGNYTGQLIYFKGIERIVVQNFSGQTTQRLQFKDLSAELVYRIEVQFKSENDFLCQKKILDDISLKDDN
jgi:hypothetical protein